MERQYATEVLTKRYHEQCELFPRTREIGLALYLQRNVPTLIANWHKRAIAHGAALRHEWQRRNPDAIPRDVASSYHYPDEKYGNRPVITREEF